MNSNRFIVAIKAFLFDIDGTLVDSSKAHVFSMTEAVKELGLPPPEKSTILSLIGAPIERIAHSLVKRTDLEQEFIESYRRKEYKEGGIDLLRPYPHVKQTLLRLKKSGFKVGIVTTKRRETYPVYLDMVGIETSIFDVIVCAEDVKRLKPDPEGILRALHVLRLPPKSAAMVGDTSMDIEASKKASVISIGVTYGFGKDLRGADFIVDDISEVLHLARSELAISRRRRHSGRPST